MKKNTTHTNRRALFGLILGLATFVWPMAGFSAEDTPPSLAEQSPTTLSAPLAIEDIPWGTNMDEPLIGDPNALKGGTFYSWMPDYPLTFRLVGPNSNDAFASWNRAYTMEFGLVTRHPVTDAWIPWMATHWAVMDDQRTVYYKLDPDARWSDGEKITAHDYVFTDTMMRSEFIVDPFYNNYAQTYFESVEALDDYTLKIVGPRPSWRPLADYNLWPMPEHAIELGPNWVEESNTKWQVAAGPYVVTEAQPGKYVIFDRIKDWWGTDKRYFKGMYNVDRFFIQVIPVDRSLDFFKKGELTMEVVSTAKTWATEMDFEAAQKGWVHRKLEYLEMPQGIYGLHMNLEAPIFQNKDFRKAMQYLFPFEVLNRELMYDAYVRVVSAFEGTEYANPELIPYGFNPRKAKEHLEKAGYTERGSDGILVNAEGQRASFSLIYGTKSIERHLTVVQDIYKRAGVEMNLKLLEGAAAFNRGLERKYEMTLTSRAAGYYPSPYQYFHSDFKEETNNNNIWGFGTPATDKLIDIYRFDLNKANRLGAMHELDAIIQDEAFYIPFWTAPYIRFIYWDYLQFPETYFPKRTQSTLDWQVFWIDPERKQRLDEAMAAGESLTPDSEIVVDPWEIKEEIDKREGVASPIVVD